jgi:hypothetical protein
MIKNPDKERVGLFGASLKNSSDYSDDYLNRTGLIEKILGNGDHTSHNRSLIRALLENPRHGSLGRFDAIPQATLDEVRNWQAEGLIGAVDGSDAIYQTALPEKVVYGAAVASMTSKQRSEPVISFTYTYQSQEPRDIDDLVALQEELAQATEITSWTRSYREFKERQEALRLVREGCRLVLIDGPIFTQNLMTQEIARNTILAEMQADQCKFIGYIKEQNQFHKHLGAALESGEYWVFESFRNMLGEKRFRSVDNPARVHPAASWVRHARHWVRCIYKINQKAYEFECDPAMVQHGLAVLKVDANPTLHHEIPFLLELVDRYVRSQAEPQHISDDLVNSLGAYALAFSNERIFR